MGLRSWTHLGGGSFAYLIRISVKYGVDLRGLLMCLQEAWKEGSSALGSMIVQLRVKDEDHGVFMIKRGEEMVAQLRFYEVELERMRRLKDSDLGSLKEAWSEQEYQKLKVKTGERRPEILKIRDLRAGLRRVKVRATVVERSEPRMVDARDGRRLFLSVAMVSDGTGTIRMPLWGRRVDMVSLGDTVLVEDARVVESTQELQLLIGRGKITVKEES